MGIDFEKYSLEDLRSSLASIDKEKYPENYQKLLAAIEKKQPGGGGRKNQQASKIGLGHLDLFSAGRGLFHPFIFHAVVGYVEFE